MHNIRLYDTIVVTNSQVFSLGKENGLVKRVLMFALILTCLIGLVGCDPGTNMVDGNDLLENTIKIELYSYENTNPNQIKLNGKNMPIFDFNKATFIASLDKSHYEDIINDISEQECHVYDLVLNEPIGKTIVLYQNNGDMVVLFSCVYKNGNKLTRYYGECNVFDEKGIFIEHIGRIGSDYVDRLEATYFGTII